MDTNSPMKKREKCSSAQLRTEVQICGKIIAKLFGENPEGIAFVVPVFFTKEYIKEYFDIIEK